MCVESAFRNSDILEVSMLKLLIEFDSFHVSSGKVSHLSISFRPLLISYSNCSTLDRAAGSTCLLV